MFRFFEEQEHARSADLVGATLITYLYGSTFSAKGIVLYCVCAAKTDEDPAGESDLYLLGIDPVTFRFRRVGKADTSRLPTADEIRLLHPLLEGLPCPTIAYSLRGFSQEDYQRILEEWLATFPDSLQTWEGIRNNFKNPGRRVIAEQEKAKAALKPVKKPLFSFLHKEKKPGDDAGPDWVKYFARALQSPEHILAESGGLMVMWMALNEHHEETGTQTLELEEMLKWHFHMVRECNVPEGAPSQETVVLPEAFD